MKKFNNKKGFTIVELVIVIAVIGILAGVLIPTFSGIVQRANESKINQEMTNALKVVLAGNATSGALAKDTTFVMSQKDGDNKDVAAYYAKYNGNKFEKIVTIDKNNKLETANFNRVIIGTNKEGDFYKATIDAIANLYSWTGDNAKAVKGTNDVYTIGSLTVLTNSDLSEGMFVLVPADNAQTTTKYTVTVEIDESVGLTAPESQEVANGASATFTVQGLKISATHTEEGCTVEITENTITVTNVIKDATIKITANN